MIDLRSDTVTRPTAAMREIMARAEAELKSTTDALYATAVPLHRKYFPGADAAALAELDQRS